MDNFIKISTEIIKRCVLENPDLPLDFIKDILVSKNQDRSLAEKFSFDKLT